MTSTTIAPTSSMIDTAATPVRSTDRGAGFLHTLGQVFSALSEGLEAARTYEKLASKGIDKVEAARLALECYSDARR